MAAEGLAGLAGLAERARKPPPRAAVTDEVRDEILAATLIRPPAEPAITHWSSRLLADWLALRGTQGLPRFDQPVVASIRDRAMAIGDILRDHQRPGSYTSARELIAPIGRFIDAWNDHREPFTWTTPAQD